MATTVALRHSLRSPIGCWQARKTLSVVTIPNQMVQPCPAGRRDCLLLTATTAAMTLIKLPPASAQDIPLFGLRKKIAKVEKEAEELVKEGFEAAEKGVETAEKAAIETAEKDIEMATSNGLGQAGVVAGAEVLGVLVATSVVNGILGPDAQRS